VAIVDESGKGVGVFQPDNMTFNAGFHGGDANKGQGGEKSGQTGHIAPIGRQILDHNISWTYTTAFVLGTVDDIRSYAKNNRKVKSCPAWVFQNSRHDWYYAGNAKDTGWPITNMLNVQNDGGGRLMGPVTFWEAKNAPFLEIEGAFKTNSGDVTVDVLVQPVGKSDFTDWLNWSEGKQDAEAERTAKESTFPATPPFTVVQKLKADGTNQVHRIRLADSPAYQGTMKSISIGLSEAGTARIKSIKLSEK
jgi:hypothetical protein